MSKKLKPQELVEIINLLDSLKLNIACLVENGGIDNQNFGESSYLFCRDILNLLNKTVNSDIAEIQTMLMDLLGKRQFQQEKARIVIEAERQAKIEKERIAKEALRSEKMHDLIVQSRVELVGRVSIFASENKKFQDITNSLFVEIGKLGNLLSDQELSRLENLFVIFIKNMIKLGASEAKLENGFATLVSEIFSDAERQKAGINEKRIVTTIEFLQKLVDLLKNDKEPRIIKTKEAILNLVESMYPTILQGSKNSKKPTEIDQEDLDSLVNNKLNQLIVFNGHFKLDDILKGIYKIESGEVGVSNIYGGFFEVGYLAKLKIHRFGKEEPSGVDLKLVINSGGSVVINRISSGKIKVVSGGNLHALFFENGEVWANPLAFNHKPNRNLLDRF